MSEGARGLRGLVAIVATYIYFLLFAQYGFLRLLETRLDASAGSSADLKAVMAAMGLAGLGISLATGHWLARIPARVLLRAGFTGAAGTALVSLAVRGTAGFMLVALLIGASTALITVALAADLRALVPGGSFGLKIGIGTGAAYLFCNLPVVFSGDPRLQAILAAAVAGVGFVAVRPAPQAEKEPPGRVHGLGDPDYRGLGFVTVVLSFLALVWLDSAVFSIIRQTPALDALTWHGADQKWALGTIHLVAAAASGWLIDRGLFRSLLVATLGLFAFAFNLLGDAETWLLAGGPLYVAAVSTYSVALVVYPASCADRPGLIPARWRAAVLYGFAGWLGSALGIGMAENLHHIPRPFVWTTGALVLAAWTLGRRFSSRLLRAHRIPLGAAVLAAGFYLVAPNPVHGPYPAGAVQRGREVYVSEGCINCHSQYVRPETRDVEWWGPHRDRDPVERPVLIGNRRQGPDLLNVGLRRSTQWQRLHLIDPRSVSPGSRMPSYAHLFEAESRRGADLVAYLGSLGAAGIEERYGFTQAWDASTAARSLAHGGELFGRLCAPCHGAGARGDGPVGRLISRPAMDLLKENFWLVSWGPGAEPEPSALARVVKFGVPGTTMAGHETLSAVDIADIVGYLRALRATHTAQHATDREDARGGG